VYTSVLGEVNQVVHFAAESHVDRSNNDGIPFLKSNILGTYRLLEATRARADIRTLLVSTDEVYGSIENGTSDESSQLNPSSAYSVSKTSSDLFGLAMFHTFNQDVVISRGCNTYGPYQHLEKLIPLCISRLLLGHKAPLYGDGLNIREWIYVSDHTAAIEKILKSGKSGNIYNIGTGIRFTNREILNLILLQLKLSQESLVHVADRPGHDRRYALNAAKLSLELGWKPQIDFSAGLIATINWYKEKLGAN
jgi:dTDP-glucose 4,6-dehydratase